MENETGDKMEIHPPHFKWEWNINSLGILCGFMVGIAAWGYTLNDLVSAKAAGIEEDAKIWAELKRLDESNRRFENVEFRVTLVEGQARDSAKADIDQAKQIAEIASDVRVTREILERIERVRASAVAKP